MQTSTPAAAAAPETTPRHLRVELSEPWDHRGPGVEAVGYVPLSRGSTEVAKVLANRAVLSLTGSAFALSLNPTALELRNLAHLCTTLADELDMAAQRDRAARQLAGDFALTERAA